MLDKKQIQAIFLFKFKMGCKAPETTLNIHNTFGSGPANEHTVWWWLKKSSKGDESLEDEECSGQTSEADNDQLRAIIEADSLTTTWEVSKEFSVDHSMVIHHLRKLERWKILVSGCLMSWPQILKNGCFEVSSFFIPCNNDPFLNLIVMCGKKWIL